MLFNSFSFFVFFPIVTALYFLLPQRFRWILLLSASAVFYMAFIPSYILILVAVILVDYFAGQFIETSEGKKRKAFLIVSLVTNIGILGVFKYCNFFNVNVTALAHFIGWNYSLKALSIILPIGLSFHTFQAMSYTIEVYRGKQKPEKHLGIYALYVMFYPQLVAGPIERPQNLIHQFHEEHHFDYRRVTDGLRLMGWGLFKKVVIADNLAPFVNMIYGNPRHYHSGLLLLATLFFAYQIYCDFSGYSDIAIGAAQVMGYKLMLNFNRPYFSKSVSEFWQRWHISLSTWFRDYLYISLGGNRVSKLREYLNILIVFIVSGFWHGANWTFMVWGLLHGVFVTVERLTQKIRQDTLKVLRIGPNSLPVKIAGIAITFSLVSFAWIFFRAANLTDAMYISTHIWTGFKDFTSLAQIKNDLIQTGYTKFDASYVLAALVAIVIMETVHVIQRNTSIRNLLNQKEFPFRLAAYYTVILFIFCFGQFYGNKFIYFQF